MGRAQRQRLFILTFSLSTLLGVGPALAGDNDLELRRLAERQEVEVLDSDGLPVTRFNALPDLDAFKTLSRDIGVVFAPKFLAPAETLGQAGFDLGVDVSLHMVDASLEHWRALNSADAPNTMVTGQLHVRKGLPFSFEIGATLTHLFDSEMFAPGMELKFSLNEGFFYLPDIALRGAFNVVVGSSDLNLATTGFDISISKSFGLVGAVNLTPYAGYNQLVVIASSRLLDVAPEDPTQPTINEDTGLLDFQPEFVFDTEVQTLNRFFFGTRLLFGVLNLTFEGALTNDVQTYSGRLGFDF
jgi:hypothetical protein